MYLGEDLSFKQKPFKQREKKAPTAPRDATYLYNYALWYLGRWSASSGHLAKVLARKWQAVQTAPRPRHDNPNH